MEKDIQYVFTSQQSFMAQSFRVFNLLLMPAGGFLFCESCFS